MIWWPIFYVSSNEWKEDPFFLLLPLSSCQWIEQQLLTGTAH